MQFRRTIGLAAAVAALTVAVAQPVAARSGDVIARGACDGGSAWKLKLAPRDGRIEVEFEVDSNRNGQIWTVTLADNTIGFFRGTAKTKAPSGSFTVRTTTADLTGTDHVTGTATHAGETCVASASL
ncbi:MAG: hypothetical protein Q7S35_01350 [Candidatus Limnocylindrales bacterium]|nr:hypothetical protein [Candidatus Limnocylindrales bacterium]